MITIRTTYLGELRTKAIHLASGNEILTDAPKDNHGKGEAFSPTDLLAASLGSCAISIVGIAARTHGFSVDGTNLEITKVMASNPRRVAEVHVALHFPPNNYTDKEKKIIEHAVHTCPVSLSLHPELKQIFEIHFQ
ncbi:MAG: hypothetical protein RIQ89_2133 [Bacteroidota bacterium]|jgi:putative redox protein